MTIMHERQDRGADVPTAVRTSARSWTGRNGATTAAGGSAPRPPRQAGRGAHSLLRALRAWRAEAVLVLIAVECGMAIGVGIQAQAWGDWTDPGAMFTALSRVAAMAGTALSLASLLLAARIPWIERSLGQDRLVAWHRTWGPYSLYLILTHVVLVTIGYGIADKVNLWSEFWNMVLTMEWMLPALAGFACMMMIGVTSWRRARSRMRYETWWAIHLYAYLGVALSFMHQIKTGSMFVGEPALTRWWVGLYLLTFGLIVWFRGFVPLLSSLFHDLRVERVIHENHNTVSIVMRGRRIDELGARGGQFLGFRFMTRRYWWESHPYSLSASPRENRLRITVKDLGDHSQWLRDVRPGTRVWIEGPYGAFTADRVTHERVTLIAGGVGITPIRALLEELPLGSDIDLLWRASTEADLMLREEVEELAALYGARLHYLVGSRRQVNLDVRTLRALVPDVARSDVFLCGPTHVVEQAIRSLTAMGVPADRLHHEAFAY